MPQNATPLTPNERFNVIRYGLVGPHVNLYYNSAAFHAQMDSLSSMVAIWVDALAKEAEAAEAGLRQRVVDDMNRLPRLDEDMIKNLSKGAQRD
jgi:hypothetical protein